MANVYAANAMCAKLQKENTALRAALELAYRALSEERGFLQSTTAIEIRAALAAARGEG